ncbi:GntR family transcriptional regulator [Streptomyces sp. NPDC057137]|uniref:GntR family transcriptional regulator n=1 Tax=Streptomyces sp. NPDC057137 TaxID=3346030 RepID=UPI00363EC2D0
MTPSQEELAEESGSLRGRTISEIRRRIISADLAQDRTFSEAALADELGVGRAPVREALIVLSHSGWVDTLPRSGYRVKAMTLNELRDLFAVRLALEPQAAAAAARRAPHPEDAAAALLAHCDLEEQGTASAQDLVTGHYRFHRRIALLTGNAEFDRALRDVLLRTERYHLLDTVVRAANDEPLPHRPLADAVITGDGAAAAEAMSRLITQDQRRTIDAIIDSDLIRSVTLTPRPRRTDAVSKGARA